MTDKQEKPEKPFHFSPRPNRAAEIGWLEWGPEAFRRSQQESKPILLSIAAAWCHWCHVMDETSYSDGDIIKLANERFIPVRVDNDQRPDVNKRYNQGGWPTVALLTPGGEIIAGTTYLKPDPLKRLLGEVANLYSTAREEVETAVQKIQEQRAGLEQPSPGDLTQAVMAYVLEIAGDVYDKDYGGFGATAKFPYPGLLSLILSMLNEGSIAELEEMLGKTLGAMAGGGMYDQVEGGFFRYATDREWTIPHYEKLLEDNAALLRVYAEASHILGNTEYEKIARDIYRYLTSVLLNPDTGAFGGSQDADEEYYALAADGRKQRGAPAVDPTVYAGWNALAASSMLRAFQLYGDEEFRRTALGALDFVWTKLWDREQGLYHFYDGEPHVPGLLADAAGMAAACLDAYESGAGEEWLNHSIEVAGWMLDNLEDKTGGGFYDCVTAPGEAGLASERTRPPVENSQAAAVLIRLKQNTGQVRFTEAAERTLQFYAGSYRDLGLFAADYAMAVQRYLEPPVRVTISGPPGEPGTTEMIRAAQRARIPFRSIEVLDPEIHGEELEATGYGYAGKPIAYICIGASCQPAVTNPDDLPGRLEAGWAGVSR